MHHGSGPRTTNLLDPDFPRLLAEYAGAVARRYPWVDLYTPVNEPLTTARFSAFTATGIPIAATTARSWPRCCNQVTATALAMRAIRAVNPRARLVQTEDAGRTYSTPGLDTRRRSRITAGG